MTSTEKFSRNLPIEFREFCVEFLVLRQINDCFSSAGIRKGVLSSDKIISSQRRKLVEEYYSSLNWEKQEDVDKFLQAIQFVYVQTYSTEKERNILLNLLKREGYVIEGLQIRRSIPSVLERSVKSSETISLEKLRDEFLQIEKLEVQVRGYAFEKFLVNLFSIYGLNPKSSFRLTGEQIDGSFQIGNDVYLVEAKWQSKQTSQDDLLIFREKVENKSTWTRGLFISYSGFTEQGLSAFARGRATNIVGMNGQDLYYVLTLQMSLIDAIQKKVRRAAETGEFFVSVYTLSHGG